MPRKRHDDPTFWTPERLRELRKCFKKLKASELERKFNKPLDQIVQAYNFDRLHRILKVETIRERGVRVTVYASGYGEGTTTSFHGLDLH